MYQKTSYLFSTLMLLSSASLAAEPAGAPENTGNYTFPDCSSIRAEDRFTDHKNGTVTDNCTKLIWLQNANCFGGQKWAQANNLEKLMNNKKSCLPSGTSAQDWRLPTVCEWLSMMPLSFSYQHLLFSNLQTRNSKYWSSTKNAKLTDLAWYVNFHNGSVHAYVKRKAYYVWPVRRSQ